MNNIERESGLKIGKKAFLFSAGIILVLMIASGILTLVLPPGEYQRTVSNGRTLVVPGSYAPVAPPDYPIYRWFTAPVEILFAPGNIPLITIILFIIFVSGSIAILEAGDIMQDLIQRLVRQFGKNKYQLIGIIIFLFMFVSSFLGIYEGMVPMIVFIVPLALSLGWDSLTGLGMSLLPLAFGFASAVTNPFTVAVAQKIADLPLFSGSWLRVIFFVVVYFIVTAFVVRHAKKVEKNPSSSLSWAEDEGLRRHLKPHSGTYRAGTKQGLVWFSICIFFAIAMVIVAGRVPALSDLSFPVMGLLFFIGGIGAGLFAGMGPKEITRVFLKGNLGILPGIVLILLSYSVKHIILNGKIMDTILWGAANLIGQSPALWAAFLVYAVTLGMNFFIGSASAKAFLMMPLLVPLADLVGITRQTAVLAFDFGDGFSNMVFPTNALLLIALGFTVVSYPKWIAWTAKLQLVMLGVTSVFLAFAVMISFGPF